MPGASTFEKPFTIEIQLQPQVTCKIQSKIFQMTKVPRGKLHTEQMWQVVPWTWCDTAQGQDSSVGVSSLW